MFGKNRFSNLTPGIGWPLWKRRWRSCKDLPTALGLLQSIYETDHGGDPSSTKGWYEAVEAHKIEPTILLLETADGHRYPRSPEFPDKVRDKAFQILATQFFSNSSRGFIGDLPVPVRDKLVWFFLDRERAGALGNWSEYKNVLLTVPQNISKRHQLETAAQFLDRFCEWHWEQSPGMRPIILEILHYQGDLLRLLPTSSSYRYAWGGFDKETRAKLHELALRDAETVETGIVLGSAAAQLHLLVTAGFGELERLGERISEFDIYCYPERSTK